MSCPPMYHPTTGLTIAPGVDPPPKPCVVVLRPPEPRRVSLSKIQSAVPWVVSLSHGARRAEAVRRGKRHECGTRQGGASDMLRLQYVPRLQTGRNTGVPTWQTAAWPPSAGDSAVLGLDIAVLGLRFEKWEATIMPTAMSKIPTSLFWLLTSKQGKFC
ncbi:unnamed protein product [Cuscuta campestris]|uniref:Uncharacterized protein n=1 Tax=Cuscuta campestris TaxID=132261 RepID=A0A484N0F8_9ASTE|nr:unnamed protein product [Cuscuta campestris]